MADPTHYPVERWSMQDWQLALHQAPYYLGCDADLFHLGDRTLPDGTTVQRWQVPARLVGETPHVVVLSWRREPLAVTAGCDCARGQAGQLCHHVSGMARHLGLWRYWIADILRERDGVPVDDWITQPSLMDRLLAGEWARR